MMKKRNKDNQRVWEIYPSLLSEDKPDLFFVALDIVRDLSLKSHVHFPFVSPFFLLNGAPRVSRYLYY